MAAYMAAMASNIDEATIDRLVETFYARVRQDAVLSPVFDAAIGDHWPEHLSKLKDFWSSVMLGTRRFNGRPMYAHAILKPPIGAAHFERWLGLFEETAVEVCAPEDAARFIERARMIGQSFQLGLAAMRGELPV